MNYLSKNFLSICGSLWWLMIPCVLTKSDEQKLYDDLMSSYNALYRPVGNFSDRLLVKMGLTLSQIIDINLKNQIMSSNVWVQQEWVDANLRWEPDDYSGIRKLHIPAEQIWLPDIVLYNNADGDYVVTKLTKALVTHDGKVMWGPPAIFKSSCTIDVEYFPFDQQTCQMKFGIWSYDGLLIDLKHINQQGDSQDIPIGMDLSRFYLSVEWDIMDVPAARNEIYYSCCTNPYIDIRFNITLRRKTLFYTVNLIIPCVAISGLCIFVFYLPSDSGEKIALSISIMLSLVVFFLLLSEILPPTSLGIPLLGRYLLFTLILVTLSVCLTILVLNINFRSPSTHRMAPWVKKVFLNIIPRLLKMERPKKKEKEHHNLNGHSTIYRRYSGNIVSPSEDSNDFPPPPPPESPDKVIMTDPIDLEESNLQPSFIDVVDPTPVDVISSLPPYNEAVNYKDDLVSQSQDGLVGVQGETSLVARSINYQPVKSHSSLQHALLSIQFVAQHMDNMDSYCEVEEDWKYVAMVLDRLLLWVFAISCIVGTIGIIAQAPSLYDRRKPIDVLYSKIAQRMRY